MLLSWSRQEINEIGTPEIESLLSGDSRWDWSVSFLLIRWAVGVSEAPPPPSSLMPRLLLLGSPPSSKFPRVEWLGLNINALHRDERVFCAFCCAVMVQRSQLLIWSQVSTTSRRPTCGLFKAALCNSERIMSMVHSVTHTFTSMCKFLTHDTVMM